MSRFTTFVIHPENGQPGGIAIGLQSGTLWVAGEAVPLHEGENISRLLEEQKKRQYPALRERLAVLASSERRDAPKDFLAEEPDC